MAAAVAFARRERQRTLKQKQDKGFEEHASQLYDRYDTNKNGRLEREQMNSLLTHANGEKAPPKEILDRIMKEHGEFVDGQLGIPKVTIEGALKDWRHYADDQAFIHVRLAKFGEKGTTYLDKTGLIKMMTQMNKGKVPTDQDVDTLMAFAGKEQPGYILPHELRPANEKWKEMIAENTGSSTCVLL